MKEYCLDICVILNKSIMKKDLDVIVDFIIGIKKVDLILGFNVILKCRNRVFMVKIV